VSAEGAAHSLLGPRARALAELLERYEAPGINTVQDGDILPPWAQAEGCHITDVDGRTYLDLTSGFGVAAIGHRHPRVVAAIKRQADQLLHGLADAAAHALRARLAERLARLAPMAQAQVYFAVSGADAIEIALKTAQLRSGRTGILCFEPSYHGLSLGALAATSRSAFAQPFVARLSPHVTRLPFGAALDDVAFTLAAGSIGACIVEPVVGREGVLLPPAGWLAGLAALCRRHGSLLVADEVFTGFGRTGALFASVAEGAVPDLLCCGKALGGGLPLAAVLASRDTFAVWRDGGEARHTGTFVAHPLACAAALATLEVLEEERLVERAAALENDARALLGPFAEHFAVRGRGLLWGIELPERALAARWSARALAHGVYALAGGPHGTVLQIAPPLTIARAQLEAAISGLAAALAEL
jgi:4-aminobutyrate aminotransferase-like enzyme